MNITSPTEFYTLSLHDALPIYRGRRVGAAGAVRGCAPSGPYSRRAGARGGRSAWARRAHGDPGIATSPCTRSEEHTSELQSHSDLVCRLLLEKKKRIKF